MAQGLKIFWSQDLNVVIFIVMLRRNASVSDLAFLILKNPFSMQRILKPLSPFKLVISLIVRARFLVARDQSLSSKL